MWWENLMIDTISVKFHLSPMYQKQIGASKSIGNNVAKISQNTKMSF